MNLKDKKVLITGATGGIGKCIVEKFTSLGSTVLATGTNDTKLQNLKKNFPEIIIEKFDLSGYFKIFVNTNNMRNKCQSILNIPTIGIGASPKCDGQILVTEDMLGLTNVAPKFVKKYVDLDNTIKKAVSKYAEEVKDRTFPSSDHIYHMRPQSVSNNGNDQ